MAIDILHITRSVFLLLPLLMLIIDNFMYFNPFYVFNRN